MPHLASILREAGQAYRNRTVDILRGDASAEAIASVLGIPIAEVVYRRGHTDAQGRFTYRDVEMRPTDVSTRERRFAPGSLREKPIHRSAWMIKLLPFCPISWEPLIYRCTCGAHQDWTAVRDILRCSGCGTLLTDMIVDKIPARWRPYLQIYADLLSPDSASRAAALRRLPEDVAVLSPGQAVELILTLVPSAELGIRRTARDLSVWRERPMLLSKAIAKVVEGMLAGEAATARLLLGGRPKHVEPRSRHLSRLAKLLTGRGRIDLPEPITDIFDEAEQAISVPGKGEETSIDFMEAELLLKRPRATLRAARRDGTLRTAFRIRRGEVFPALDRAEIERLASEKTLGLAKMGRALGQIPLYGVAQLADVGLLRYAEHPFTWKTKGVRILQGEEKRLLATLGEGSSKLQEDDTVTLYSVLRGIGGNRPIVTAMVVP
ncbi:hypothetical protein [Sphingobium sp. DC-2]|uniref:hypothetical protein n=1 Tax=Sphingobium sp. DC-2 TaxID=1303256 RepID=UPI000A635E92|nr:hypothetical protein [Sphingobium sp. DC-2]